MLIEYTGFVTDMLWKDGLQGFWLSSEAFLVQHRLDLPPSVLP